MIINNACRGNFNQKRYASLLLVSNTTFPAWNNLKSPHIVTLFSLTHKENFPKLFFRKSNVLSLSIVDDGSECHSLILSNLSSSLYYISGERSVACGYGQTMHCLLPILLLSAGIILEEFRRSFGEVFHKLLFFDISPK